MLIDKVIIYKDPEDPDVLVCVVTPEVTPEYIDIKLILE